MGIFASSMNGPLIRPNDMSNHAGRKLKCGSAEMLGDEGCEEKSAQYRFVRDFISRRRAQTVYQDFLSSTKNSSMGRLYAVHCLPCSLCLVLERGLEVSQRVQRVIVYMMCFADDFTSIVGGENSIQDAGEVVGVFDEKCVQLSLKVNYKKTNSMKVLTAIPNDRLIIQNNSIT